MRSHRRRRHDRGARKGTIGLFMGNPGEGRCFRGGGRTFARVRDWHEGRARLEARARAR